MSSPPDLAPLRISSPADQPASKSTDGEAEQAGTSPSTDERKEDITTQANGDAAASTPTPATPATATPPPSSAAPAMPEATDSQGSRGTQAAASPAPAAASSASRPTAPLHTVSSPPTASAGPGAAARAGPGFAGRPGVGAMAGRPGVQGPTAMSLRGGPQGLPAKLPPSLQAKMDRVSPLSPVWLGDC